MKIGIIGSGNIGGNLGLHLARAGHSVLFSSRHPEELSDLIKEAGENSCAGKPDEAARFGDVVVLSVPFKHIESLSEELAESLKGKVILDTCNPYPKRDGDIARQVKEDKNLRESEHTARHFPDAHVVKAFNTVYYVHLKDKAFRTGEEQMAVPLAGDDADARRKVAGLISDIGFAPVDLGGMDRSAPMEVDQALYAKEMKPGEMLNLIKRLS